MHDQASSDPSDPGAKRRRGRVRSFSRRGGRMIRRYQKTLKEHGPRYVLDLPRGDSPTTIAEDARVDLAAAFGNDGSVVVEIGPGSGEQLVSPYSAHDYFYGRTCECRHMISLNQIDFGLFRMIDHPGHEFHGMRIDFQTVVAGTEKRGGMRCGFRFVSGLVESQGETQNVFHPRFAHFPDDNRGIQSSGQIDSHGNSFRKLPFYGLEQQPVDICFCFFFADVPSRLRF